MSDDPIIQVDAVTVICIAEFIDPSLKRVLSLFRIYHF